MQLKISGNSNYKSFVIAFNRSREEKLNIRTQKDQGRKKDLEEILIFKRQSFFQDTLMLPAYPYETYIP